MPQEPWSRAERFAKARENAAELGLPGVSGHVLSAERILREHVQAGRKVDELVTIEVPLDDR